MINHRKIQIKPIIIDTNKLRNWFWRWLLLKLLKHKSPTTVLFRTTHIVTHYTNNSLMWKLMPINRSYKSTLLVGYGLFIDKQLIDNDCYWLSLAVSPINYWYPGKMYVKYYLKQCWSYWASTSCVYIKFKFPFFTLLENCY